MDCCVLDFKKAIKVLSIIPDNRAVRLRAFADCEIDGVKRMAGEMWQLEGRTTYIPSPNVVNIFFKIPTVYKYKCFR